MCVLQDRILTQILQSLLWSVTLMEEQRLRVFVNKLLTGMFGPKTERQMAEVISGGKKKKTPKSVIFK